MSELIRRELRGEGTELSAEGQTSPPLGGNSPNFGEEELKFTSLNRRIPLD